MMSAAVRRGSHRAGLSASDTSAHTAVGDKGEPTQA